MKAIFLGTTGDVQICDKCGKAELKGTVVIEIDGIIGHYGCICAARLLGMKSADVAKEARTADAKRRDALHRRNQEIRKAIQNHPLHVQFNELKDKYVAKNGASAWIRNEDGWKSALHLTREAERLVRLEYSQMEVA